MRYMLAKDYESPALPSSRFRAVAKCMKYEFIQKICNLILWFAQ